LTLNLHLGSLRPFHDVLYPDHAILNSIQAFLLLFDQLLHSFELLVNVLLDLLQLTADDSLLKLLLA
jgi:hypothetical protein